MGKKSVNVRWCLDMEVWRTRVVLVPEALCPLQELQVVLHLALDQLLDRDRPVDMVFAESVGEDLEVLEVGVLGVDVKLDARHGDVEEDAVVDLAEGGAVHILLDE